MPGSFRNAPRVLLVTASEEELRAFGLALHRDGLAITRVASIVAAAEALQAEDFDAAVISHPLPDGDVIACCAALAGIPSTPPTLLIDALDPWEQTIPATVRPARMMRKPVEPAKLASELREMIAEACVPEAQPEPATFELAAALIHLARDGETGVLEVESDELHARIFLRGGAAVSAEGGSLRETLGRMLLRHGALSEADYTRVIERMTERVMANEHQRMGEVLVEFGLLTGEEVHAALRDQVFEKVTACFRWSNPQWSFSELDELPEGLEPFSLPPIESMVLRGLQEHARPEAVAAFLAPHDSARPRLTRGTAAEQERLRLDAAQLRLLERMDGSHTMAALGRDLPESKALLATLLLTEALDLDTAVAAPKRAAGKSRPQKPPRVTFTREVVGRRKGASGSQDAKAAPEPADDSQARLEAEQCFRKGRELLDADKPLEAAKLLRRAVELEPGEPEYALAESWASYLEAKHSVRVARAKTLTAARRLLQADPKAPKGHTTLGRLALEDGDLERATREFEFALLRNPEDPEAKKGLKQSRG